MPDEVMRESEYTFGIVHVVEAFLKGENPIYLG